MFSSYSSEPEPSQGNSPTTFEEELAALRRFADNPKIKRSTRERARELAAYVEQSTDHIAAQIKEHSIDILCQELGDEQLARLVADAYHHGRESMLHRASYQKLASYYQANRWLPNWRFHWTVWWLFDLGCVALIDELWRRQRQRENANGIVVRKLLVEEEERGERLTKLSKRVSRGLRFPGQPSEAYSCAVESIWERVAELCGKSPVPAANPDALLAFMHGDLNRVLTHVRDDVRNRVETELRRTAGWVSSASRPASADAEDPPPLVEQLASPVDEEKRHYLRLLVEQVTERADLTEKEKKLLEMWCVEGRTQKEAAAKLGLSQGEVSKSLQEIRDKMRQVLQFQPDSNPPPEP